jgi:hypothetical protein
MNTKPKAQCFVVNEHRFRTQAQAIAYANFFHRITGIIVAVEARAAKK